jgi:hypothetical protein
MGMERVAGYEAAYERRPAARRPAAPRTTHHTGLDIFPMGWGSEVLMPDLPS